MIRKTTPAHEAQGAHELSQFGWKIKSKHTHVVILLVFFLTPPPRFTHWGQELAKEETFVSEGGSERHIQLWLIPWK